MGARLRQLGVPTIIIEKNDRPGDSWRNRYKSLCLHDPVWYDHLPYLKFPENWPVFSPKDKIGDWLEMYTKVMELNYWTRTTAKSATFDEVTGKWTIVVDRDGKEVVLQPTQLVMATGMSGKKRMPEFPGMDRFKGIQQTHIVRSETLMEIGLGDLYSERALASGMTTEKADLIFASLPYRILHEFQIPAYAAMKEQDKDFYEGLEKAGFWLDWGDDESGLFMKYLRRGSGYYIDVGASQLIIDGEIKLKRGQVKELDETGVILDDGSHLDADLVVYATGYNSMNGWVADLMGQGVADQLGKCWGLGSDTTKDPGPWEGEQRNMWKPTQVPNLWMHGGNLHQSRHYSQFLSLQIKARLEGIPTPVYGIPKVEHVS